MTIDPSDLRAAALDSRAWPYEEARKLLKRWPDGKPANAPGGEAIVFETGYGPSGLPHIGTFNEVLRTTMVRHAFAAMSGQTTRLIAFSDDMDGLRKVPGNIPNAEILERNLGKPLTRIPDPFGKYESFAAHNNAMLRAFLDRFGFDYAFISSTEYYESGRFDDALRNVLRHFDAILDVMLPTLRAERRATYSPVLPIHPESGIVLQVPMEHVDAETGTVTYIDPYTSQPRTQSILAGAAKLQWKVDWAMRWVALGVDYEMAGKDLIDSVIQSSRITRVLGGRPPEGFNYEMFLDEKGEKISKTKGNGLSLEQWLTYGPEESLAFYAYREPKKAKQLHFGVIPRAIDDYWKAVADYPEQPLAQQLGNPVHHIHNGAAPVSPPPVSFSLLLNLVGVLGSRATEEQVRGYLARYLPGAAVAHPALDAMVPFAIAYNRDVAARPARRAPQGVESEALRDLDTQLAALPSDASAEDVQTIVYEIGKARFGKEALRDWFKALYETLLGSEQGPRMGSFIALYGVGNSRKLIAEALARA